MQDSLKRVSPAEGLLVVFHVDSPCEPRKNPRLLSINTGCSAGIRDPMVYAKITTP